MDKQWKTIQQQQNKLWEYATTWINLNYGM